MNSGRRYAAMLAAVCVIGSARVLLPAQVGTLPAAIRFTDVTAQAGVRHTHVNGASGKYYYPEQFGGGAAFFDYDGDGWLDVFLAQGAPLPGFSGTPPSGNVLYRNNGDGTFSDVTGAAGLTNTQFTFGVVSADYDNDGHADLFITTLTGNVLYHNDGHGHFTDVTDKAGLRGEPLSTGAAFFDYDGDGRLDLFVARYMEYSVERDKGCRNAMSKEETADLKEHYDKEGASALYGKVYCSPFSIKGTANRLYHNNGDGTFSDVSQRAGILGSAGHGFDVAIADYNEDGRPDVFVASDMQPNLLFINQGDGTFRDEALSAGVAVGPAGTAFAGMGVDAADYDNDGHIDLFVTNYEDEPSSLYKGRGDGTFSFESNRTGIALMSRQFLKWGTRLLDLNGDGLKDIIVVNGHVDDSAGTHYPEGMPENLRRKLKYAQQAQIYLNRGEGRFTDFSAAAGPFFLGKQVGRGLAIADYDNDGDWDVLVTTNNGPATLLRNDTPPSRWARLDLQGDGCNRDAIGASVRVTSGGVTQTHLVKSGASFLSDHDRRVLTGLPGTGPATADIRWPCGATQTIAVVPGKTTKIVEQNCRLRAKKPAPKPKP